MYVLADGRRYVVVLGRVVRRDRRMCVFACVRWLVVTVVSVWRLQRDLASAPAAPIPVIISART